MKIDSHYKFLIFLGQSVQSDKQLGKKSEARNSIESGASSGY